MVDATVASERRDFYVYVIFRPNGVPCYVGKGNGRRWLFHQRNRKHYNRHLANIIAQANGDPPKIKVREGLTDAEALETEVALIAAIGRECNGGPLVNLTDGGEGVRNPTAEHRKKISDRMKGNKRNVGSKRSEETKELLRGANNPMYGKTGAANPFYAKTHSAESRQKMSKALKGKPATFKDRRHTDESRAKMSAALSGENSPNFGRRQSEETQEKRRAALKAYWNSPAGQLAKEQARIRGKVQMTDPKQLRALVERSCGNTYGKGRTHSEESKSKIRAKIAGRVRNSEGRFIS